MLYQKYPQNIEYCLFKYNFFDVKTNTIKDGKIFSPYLQFLHTGFEFKSNAEKCSIDPKKETLSRIRIRTDTNLILIHI